MENSAMNRLDIPALRSAKNILVIKFRYIGDTIWMLPFLENLKKNLPDARLTVSVNEGTDAFLYTCKAVDAVVPFPRKKAKRNPLALLSYIWAIRKTKPDVVIDLTDADRPAIMGLLSGAKVRISFNNENMWRRHLYTHLLSGRIGRQHMVQYHLDVLRELGLEVSVDSINIDLDASVFDSLRKKCPSAFDETGKKRVTIHPGSRGPLRQWGAENFARLADAISDEARIFLVGGPGEGPILEEISSRMKSRPEICTDKLSLYEFAALCELSDMFIGNDSGPIHIASAKTFVVGIFGPTKPELAGPWTEKKLIINGKDLPCRPCRQEGCEHEEFRACIESIDADEVIEKVRDALKRL